jgi:O-antigen/teichoic acid export membrane protein
MLAPGIAAYFDVPGAITAFRWLAVVPLIRGLVHCDVFRFQRELQLGRLASYQAIPTLIGVLAAPLLAVYFGNYRAFLAVIILESVLATALSHLVAQRAYRWKITGSIVRRFIGFGWPLIGNGLLMFSVMHGDRFLIASYHSLEELGSFSVVFMLSLTPTLALANLHGSIALPLFSRSRENTNQLHSYCWQSAQLMCLLAGLLATLLITAGPWLVEVIYGQRYLDAAAAIPWIGLMCAARLARTTVSMTAVAHGETKIPLISNLARAVSFLAAWLLAANGSGLAIIPLCGFIGEVFAYAISVALVGRRCGMRTEVFYGPFGLVAAFVASAWLMTHFDLPVPGIAPPLIASLWLFALVAYCGAIWPTLRQMAFTMLRTNP